MEKIRKFLISDWYAAALLAIACAVIFTGSEVFGTMFFALIIGVTMALTEDLMPALEAIMVTVCFAIRCKHSFDDFMELWWLVPPIVILVLFHFIHYRSPLKKGACFYGIAAASVAVTLGGLGKITAREYFNPNSLFYVFMLGFGMLIIYMYMSGALKIRENYVFSDRFAKLMTLVIIMLCLCIFEEYISRLPELHGNFDILPFQWRNNASTLLMLAMPFPFYLSAKKFGWFFIGMLSYTAILFSGSRGGMIFGAIELGICFVVMFIIDKKHRVPIAAITAVCLITAFILRHFLFDMLSYTIERLMNPAENAIRLQLIPRGIEDFKSNPLFGRGLGYMGNNDVHHNAEFTLCWYHCSPIQIIGSFGLLGVAAYGFLIFQRIKVLVKNFTFFNIIIFISYIGLEMMSFVNPGIFAPFPYLFLATTYFVIIERCNDDKDKKALSELIKAKKEAK
ncbi:MAG: O-antigen ligase family protein [Acutalibacteraceae bacterium]